MPSAAQVTTGSLTGIVSDPSGQPIAGADVRATDAARAIVRAAATDAIGIYRLLDLPPGRYEVVARSPGFDVRRGDVVVTIAATARLDLAMPLQSVQQHVEVTAPLRPSQTESAELGAVLDRERLSRLPLNRRDFLQLAQLAAGVAGSAEDSQLSTRGAIAMHANGAREEFNNFLLDGVDNNDPYVNGYVVQPPIEAIQEFRVATSSYSAEYGRSAGGQINVVTRSGTNELDGVAYEYFRNRALDARNFFEGDEARRYNRNQLGASIGGPVRRGRAFFFAALDFLREREGLSRLGSVPTGAARLGDLSAFGRPVVDPSTGQPFPGNVVPPSRISPLAAKVLELFPRPNRAGPAANYLGQPVQRDDVTQGYARVDQVLGPGHRLTLRYSQGRTDLFEPYAEEAGALPGFGDDLADRAHHVTGQHQWLIGGRAVSELRAGFNRLSRNLLNENAGLDVGPAWGVGWLPADSPGFPAINVAGFSRVGDVTSLPIVRLTDVYHLVESVAIDCGRHLVKVGGEVRHLRLDSRLDMLTRGSLSFSGALTGSGLGDLLLGLPSFGLQARADNPIHLRSTAFGVYLQDDWSVRRGLTVNAGVRYEYSSPPVDPNDRMSALDPSTGHLVQVGTMGVSRSGVRPDRNNIAPRVGIAWTPRTDLVMRAGYGLYYDSGMFTVSSAQYFNPPYFTLRVFFPSPARLLTLANPFPSGGGIVPPASLNTLSPDLAQASLQHWNLTLERRVGWLGTASVGYAGSRGSHLIRPRDLNQPTPGPGDVQGRRPNPAYGSVFVVESNGASDYHALQVTLNRGVARGASFWAAYTLSKSMDDASAFLATKVDRNFPQNSGNPAAERALSSFDVRHRLVVAATAGLPHRRAWTRNTEIRGILVVHSGQPLTPVLRFDNSNTGNGGTTTGYDRPNLLHSPVLADPTPERWFDTSAFAVASPYVFGNAGRNVVTGPGYVSVDVSAVRRFPRRGGWVLALEVQAFNLLNRANFDQPDLYADEPATFGRILSAKAPRQVQLALRVEF